MQISLNLKNFFLQLENQRSRGKTVQLFYYFNLKSDYDVLKSESMHFVEQKQTLIKTKRNWKLKIPHTVLERPTLCFNSCKNRKLKVKLWWVGAREEVFSTFYFARMSFFKHLCLNKNKHTFTYQNTLLCTL